VQRAGELSLRGGQKTVPITSPDKLTHDTGPA
jgi:hypothetical protein